MVKFSIALTLFLLSLGLAGCTGGDNGSPQPQLVGQGPCASLPHPEGSHVLTVKAQYSTSQGHKFPPVEEIVLTLKYDANRTAIESRSADSDGCGAFTIPEPGRYWILAVQRESPTDECAWGDGHSFPYDGSGFVHVDLSLTVACN